MAAGGFARKPCLTFQSLRYVKTCYLWWLTFSFVIVTVIVLIFIFVIWSLQLCPNLWWLTSSAGGCAINSVFVIGTFAVFNFLFIFINSDLIIAILAQLVTVDQCCYCHWMVVPETLFKISLLGNCCCCTVHPCHLRSHDTSRHDICQNFYLTGVFGAKILYKNA